MWAKTAPGGRSTREKALQPTKGISLRTSRRSRWDEEELELLGVVH